MLFASKGAIDPSTGLLGIKAFAAAAIGGFGSLPGALLGGLIIGLVEPFASRYGLRVLARLPLRHFAAHIDFPSWRDLLADTAQEGLAMRFVFKTSYAADIALFKHRAQAVWYGLLLLLLLATPLYFVVIGDAYLLGDITGILILAIAGMGLMLLTGHTGLPSLGHATFMALGCYFNINLLGAGLPWIIAFPLSGLIAGLLGTLIALPVLRLHGVYLALATLALSILTSDVVVIAEPWTGGISGAAVPDITLFGIEINRYSTPYKFYYLVLIVAILIVWVYRNLLRTATGRSFTAVRDSEISARAMGINLTRTKALSFFLSATAAGLAGALFGHSAGYVTNETFDLIMSITLLLMIVIGGLGSIHGAFFGAIVVHHSCRHRQRAYLSGDHL